MLSKEVKALKEWNIQQGEYVAKAEKEYKNLCERYLKLNGSVSCSYVDFIYEIVNCTKVSRQTKNRDLSTIMRYFAAQGRFDSLSDYLTVVEDMKNKKGVKSK